MYVTCTIAQHPEPPRTRHHGGRGGVAEDRSAGGWARAPNPGVRALAPPAAAGALPSRRRRRPGQAEEREAKEEEAEGPKFCQCT